MASSLRLSGVSSVNPLIPAPPPRDDEAVWAFFGKDTTYSRNRSLGGAAFANIGAGPEYLADPPYGRFEGNDVASLLTGVNITHTGFSFAAVFRSVAGGSGAVYRMIGSYTNDGIGSTVYMQMTSTGLLQLNGTSVGGGTDTQASIQTSFPANNNWRFVCGHLGDQGNITVYDLTDDVVSTDGGSGNDCATNYPATYLAIGQGVAGVPRTMDLPFAAIWTAAKPLEIFQQTRATVRAVLALDGITGF